LQRQQWQALRVLASALVPTGTTTVTTIAGLALDSTVMTEGGIAAGTTMATEP
jgi:hypothetical protein